MDANPLYLMIMVFVLLRYPNFIITKMKIEIKTGWLEFANSEIIGYNNDVRIQASKSKIQIREILKILKNGL